MNFSKNGIGYHNLFVGTYKGIPVMGYEHTLRTIGAQLVEASEPIEFSESLTIELTFKNASRESWLHVAHSELRKTFELLCSDPTLAEARVCVSGAARFFLMRVPGKPVVEKRFEDFYLVDDPEEAKRYEF